MTHQYKKLPVTIKMWMQYNVMPRTLVGRRRNNLILTPNIKAGIGVYNFVLIIAMDIGKCPSRAPTNASLKITNND